MKKILVLVVAAVVAIAFAAQAQEKVTVKEKAKGDTEKVTVKEKTKGDTEKITVQTKPGDVQVKDTITTPKPTMVAGTVKETVQFEEYKAGADYITVLKDNKVIRVKHTLNDPIKQDMLKKLKKGDKFTVFSTYPLDNREAVVTALGETGAAAPVPSATTKKEAEAKTAQPTPTPAKTK